MTRKQAKNRQRDWYTLSVDSLRAWTAFLAVVVALVVGYFGYRSWEKSLIESDADHSIREAGKMLDQLGARDDLSVFRDEFEEAREIYRLAGQHFREEDYPKALGNARASRSILQLIDDSLSKRDSAGEARFIAVQGVVHYRRGDAGSWEPAQSQVNLLYGDYVRTGSSGSAEIFFRNGTHYTVRPKTLFIVSKARSSSAIGATQSVKLDYGWISLNTKSQPSEVATPQSVAVVGQESKAAVSYDKEATTARFMAYKGRINVAASDGTQRVVQALQQVAQVRDTLSGSKPLPSRPHLSSPPDNSQVDFKRAPRLSLGWDSVDQASRYALQVSRNHLFVDNIIDVNNRGRASATLGLRGEGTFQWRVAAIGRDGAQGPWSAPRKFRVAAYREQDADDKTPPRLEINEVRSYGNIFILTGTTEPGSEVAVNDEPVTLSATGEFTKTVQIAKEGWSFVTVKAQDARGNETVRKRRVFVETF